MKQVRVTEPGRVDVEDVPEPQPDPGEVLLELHSAGICGGDLSLIRGTNAIARYPTVLGHECVARVAHSPDGSALAEGQYVVVYPTLSCGACRHCAAGDANRCAQMRVLGLSAPNGCFAERFALPEAQCIPLPGEVGARWGALVEPLAVGHHVVARGGAAEGDTALVIGSGVIGVSTALVARARGVRRILFADLHGSRAGVLEQLGFDEFTTATGADLARWVRDTAGPIDLVYDTVMSAATAEVATGVLGGGGRYVAIAAAKPRQRVELDYERCYAKELAVLVCRNYTRDDFHGAADLLASGAVDPLPLRTAVFDLADVDSAIAALTEQPADNLKVILSRRDLIGSGPLLTIGGR